MSFEIIDCCEAILAAALRLTTLMWLAMGESVLPGQLSVYETSSTCWLDVLCIRLILRLLFAARESTGTDILFSSTVVASDEKLSL